jgi:hypothetical protein
MSSVTMPGNSHGSGELKKLVLEPLIGGVTKTRLPLKFVGNGVDYTIIVLREKAKKVKEYSVVVHSEGKKPCYVEGFADEEGLAEALRQSCDDTFLALNSGEVAKSIFKYIKQWKALKALREVTELERKFNSRIVSIARVAGLVPQSSNQIIATQNESLNSGSGDNYVIEWLENVVSIAKSLRESFACSESSSESRRLACSAVKKLYDLVTNASSKGIDFEFLFQLMRTVFGVTLAHAFELVVTCGLTLKFVDRKQGLVGNRPVWLLLVAPPSSFKTTILNFLRCSPYAFYIDDVTKASFLPADPIQEPLIIKMHGKVTLFPSLSIIAEKKPDEAKELLAILERIYDGEYRRGTAKGARGEIVDTVVIGALTTEVFESTFLHKMLAYGSRYLIYRYTIPNSIALAIANLLSNANFSQLMQSIQFLASTLFTYAMDNVDALKLNTVVLTEEQRRDIEVLAELLAKLRFVFHRRIEYEEEEVDGKKSRVQHEVLEITQTDIPIRSYNQLLNVVRANSVIRKVPRFLGYPQVDEHAMALAAKLALTSSHRVAHNIIEYLIKNHDTTVSVNDIAKYANTPRSTIYRYLDILQAIGIITDTANPRLEERYCKVLLKHLSKEGMEV